MTQLKLSKTGKLITTIVYIGLLVFLIWPFHMGNPLNWLKAILIIGVCACNAILQGKSVLDGEFISTDIEHDYLLHYLVSCLMTVSIVVGTLTSVYIFGNEDVSFVGFVYLILGLCFGGLYFIVDIVAIISIIVRNIDRWIDDAEGITRLILKLPFANILFEQPKQEKLDKEIKRLTANMSVTKQSTKLSPKSANMFKKCSKRALFIFTFIIFVV